MEAEFRRATGPESECQIARSHLLTPGHRTEPKCRPPSPLTPPRPIQTPILNRLRNMPRPNPLLARKVGNGACDFQNAIVGAGGKPEFSIALRRSSWESEPSPGFAINSRHSA